MALPLTLTLLATAVFLLWAGLANRNPLDELISIVNTGKPRPKATA